MLSLEDINKIVQLIKRDLDYNSRVQNLQRLKNKRLKQLKYAIKLKYYQEKIKKRNEKKC